MTAAVEQAGALTEGFQLSQLADLVYHLIFDKLLRNTETKYLIPNLKAYVRLGVHGRRDDDDENGYRGNHGGDAG